jgi:hypothetical protein
MIFGPNFSIIVDRDYLEIYSDESEDDEMDEEDDHDDRYNLAQNDDHGEI